MKAFSRAEFTLQSSKTISKEETMHPFIFAVSGVKNSGKTTLITRILPLLARQGLRVAVIKHDGHDFAADVPGTDTWRQQQAGAYGTAIFSANKFMVVKQQPGVTDRN
jgi:molybdopterin-guanine dinucleotide biosynthesis protein B